MSARFRAVVWDVDGVLIDSEPLHFAALAAVCARRGYRFGADENRRWLGKGLAEMWAELPELRRLGLGFDELRAEWIAHYVAQVHAGMARRPAPAIVADLAARVVPQAAASSSPRRIVDANIAAVG
ncbi:MAG: HAD family hydrolase, partial [Alphaproteobacteria bacterium]